MIRVEKVTKFYPTTSGLHYVLRNASVEIPARAQIGVLGRNGSGKSTLMRMLSGVDVPNQGRIVKWGSVSWPLGITSGVQTQMTGRENARFACRIQGMQFDEMDSIIDFVQSFADIGHYFDMPARSYSSGMRARLGFGITMAFDFDFYIIDELSAVGDSVFKAKASEVFKQKRLKAGFVRASHNVKELRDECSSGLVINNAKLEYWPSIDDAIERYQSLTGVGETAGKARRPGKGSKHAAKPAGTPVRQAGPVEGEPANAEPADVERRAAARQVRRAERQAGREGRTRLVGT
ncbi:MAG TPA: ABC transporter ATP-binding protein [Aestuariivirgaceae bacterium]|nr:ABC transporter ATP-binding protein [Aestuariivirgaceae bacterium]